MNKQIHLKILEELKLFVQPIKDIVSSPSYRKNFLLKSGWNIDDLNGIPSEAVNNSFDEIGNKLEAFYNLLDSSDSEKVNEFFNVIASLNTIFKAIKELNKNLEKYLNEDQRKEIQNDIIQLLITKYLFDYHPRIIQLLRLYQVIQYKSSENVVTNEAKDRIIKLPFEFQIFNYKNLKNLFQSPKNFFEKTYGLSGSWETQEQVKAITDTLFPMIGQLVQTLNGQSLYGINPEYGISFGEVGDKIIANYLYLYWELNSHANIGTTLALSPKEMGDLGWVIMPSTVVGTTKQFGSWTLNTNITADFGVVTIKDGKVNTSNSEARFELGLSRKSDLEEEDEKKWAIGNREKTHIQIGQHEEKVSLFSSNGKLNMEATLGLNDIKLILDPTDADSFIAKLMDNSEINGDFDLLMGWSNLDGFFLGGGGHLDIVKSVNKDYGFLLIRDVRVQIIVSDDFQQINGRVGFSFTAKMGIITAEVEGLGPTLLTEAKDNNIQASGFNIATPETIGLQIESGAVTGSGLISFDKIRHQYNGMLHLKINEVDVSSFAIVDTRLPSGEKGFAMLISMNAEFPTPIQLGWGFTWEGIGGLIAINRTINITQLHNKFGTGIIDHILFPEEPFKNATSILSTLREVFPVKEGHDIFAPFIKIAWANFIHGEVGILVEKPSRGRVIIIGELRVAFPSEEKDWIDINVEVLGDINNGGNYILVQGQLYDSEFVGFPIFGGAAIMLDWGNNPAFLYSVGGYHPSYKKPAKFPEIPRVGFLVKYKSRFSLTCEFYYAITSNSYQTGAAAYLYAKAGPFKVEGHFMYDVLIQINPFHFDFAIQFGVSVKAWGKTLFGVGLRFQLSGPRPWNVNGYAKIRILGLGKKVRFNHTWGEREQLPKEYIAAKVLLDELKLELEKRQNWTAHLPPEFNVPERLRPMKDPEELILVHPSGYLELRQTAIPLNRPIQKSGSSYLKNGSNYRVENLQIGESHSSISTRKYATTIKEYFSRGQYEDLPEAKQLSTKDFELMDAGYRFESIKDVLYSDDWEGINSDYENIIFRDDLTIVPQDNSPIGITPSRIMSKRRTRNFGQTNLKSKLEKWNSWNNTSDIDNSNYYLVDKNNFSVVKENNGSSFKNFETQSEAKAYLDTLEINEHSQFQIMSVEEYEMEMELIEE